MSYTRTYEALDGDEKRSQAIDDIIDYVGLEEFNKLDRLLIEYVATKAPTLHEFRMILFMFPVSGYPIQAWYEGIQHIIANRAV